MQLGFTKKDSSFALVGHVPIKLSRLVASFLGALKMNSVSAQVCRSRKREVGLIVSRLYRSISLLYLSDTLTSLYQFIK